MRVIAGSARGRRLEAPKGMLTRPTADRVREALFSIIASRRRFDGAQVLDICAGTGSLGIEALSRGAAGCVFLENNRPALVALAKNLDTTGFAGLAEVMSGDAGKVLLQLAGRGRCFDLIFFDPPYASPLYSSVPEIISNHAILEEDGLLVVECAVRNTMPEHIGRLSRIDRRIYGDTALDFFGNKQ